MFFFEQEGRKSVVDKVGERAKSILKNHEPDSLPDSAKRRINDLIEKVEYTLIDE